MRFYARSGSPGRGKKTRSKDAARVLREVRRMRGRIRNLPSGEVRRTLKSAADRLEKIARRLDTESAPRKRTK